MSISSFYSNWHRTRLYNFPYLLIGVTSQVFFIIILQEYVTVVLLAFTPMVRIGQSRMSIVFAQHPFTILFVFVFIPYSSRHGIFQTVMVTRNLLFPVLRRSNQIPNETTDFLISSVKPQAVEKLKQNTFVKFLMLQDKEYLQ